MTPCLLMARSVSSLRRNHTSEVGGEADMEDIKREGGYESLRFVPKGKMIIMGIVNSKVPEVEPADSLVRKIESAAKYLDVSQLGISPQCGFASTMHGNELTEDAQWRKLEEMVKAADKVWAGEAVAA